MQKLFPGIAALAALALMTSAGQACDFHKNQHVTASVVESADESVAMSTFDGVTPPVIIEEEKVATVTECADGDASCAPKGE